MFKKLICLVCFVLVLGFVSNASAELAGHWRFDEGSGTTANDQSSNGNDGTLINNPTWAIGINNGALQFDGIDDYVNCGNDPSLNVTEAVTIAAWVKLNSVPPAFSVLIAGKYGAYWLEWRDTKVLSLSMYINGTYNGSGPTLDLADGDWHHIALTYDGTNKKGYYDKEEVFSEAASGTIDVSGNNFLVGEGHPASNSYNGCPDGLIDDVQVYDRALTQEEIQLMMSSKGYPLASGPTPEDGAIYQNTWVSLGWKAGDFAVSHDVYFCDNFDDVNDGTGDAFRGNQESTYFAAGFTGYPYPDGLAPGTTYYWRIDEVNDADPNSPWRGKVWSFWFPPKTAYEPIPGDGSKFIDSENLILNWTGGFGAILHTVYFSDNFDDVNDGVNGTQTGFANYTPCTLELDKTYYWRVDELETQGTHRGEIWSFKTLPDIAVTDPNLIGWWKLDEGPGNVAIDWSGHGNHGMFQGNPQWIAGYDGDALEFDGSGDWLDCGNDPSLELSGAVSVTAWINIGAAGIGHKVGGNQDNANGGYKLGLLNDKVEFEIRTSGNAPILNRDVAGGTILEAGVWYHVTGVYSLQDGYIRTYVNGVLDRELLTNEVLGASPGTFYIGCEPYNTGVGNFNGVMDDIRIYNKALTEDEIKEAMRGDPALAWDAKPGNRSTPYIKDATPLSWSPGENASQHDVYFGTDENAVDNADTSDTTGIYRGRQNGTTYTPPEGVEWGGGPYYWRIDQVNTDGTISTGRIWTFTVADFILVDDFENYDAGDNQIWYSWIDGLGYGAPGSDPYHPGNGTGAAVGDETTPSYTEETIVHDGGKSMPLAYDNNKQGYSRYSETELTLIAPRDSTEEGVANLSIWFRGYPASVGNFVEGPVGTFTMTDSGTDIWYQSDEFHYAYKMLTGAGSIVAKVQSLDNTNDWAKAGVMIRETLDPDSAHAYMVVTPAAGVSFQRRLGTGADSTSDNSTTGDEAAPHWVKIDRSISGSFTASHSAIGATWETLGTPLNITMGANVYVGLAVTSHDAALTCQAVFSNVTTTGNVSGQWAHQDIGITSNAAEPLYVAVSNSTGASAVVVHDDPDAANIDTWTEWVIPLQAFADQGIALTNVDRIAIGLGTQGNTTVPGGSGKMFFDDICLYQPRGAAEE